MIRDGRRIAVILVPGIGEHPPRLAQHGTAEEVVDGLGVWVSDVGGAVWVGGERGEGGGEDVEFGAAQLGVEVAGEEDAVGGVLVEVSEDVQGLLLAGGGGEVEVGDEDGERFAVGHAEAGVEEDALFVGGGEEVAGDGEWLVLGKEGDAVLTAPQVDGLGEDVVGIARGLGDVPGGVAGGVAVAADPLIHLLAKLEIAPPPMLKVT